MSNKNNLQKGRKLGSKNKISADVKETIKAIVENNLPNVMSRLDEMSVKDQANTIIQLVKFIVPTMKATELAVTEVPEGKVNIMDERVIDSILDGLRNEADNNNK